MVITTDLSLYSIGLRVHAQLSHSCRSEQPYHSVESAHVALEVRGIVVRNQVVRKVRGADLGGWTKSWSEGAAISSKEQPLSLLSEINENQSRNPFLF